MRLLATILLLAATSPALASLPSPTPIARAQEAPEKILVPERAAEWSPVIAGIVKGEIKASAKVQASLVRCIGVESEGSFQRLLPAIQAVGGKLRGELMEALETGAFDGVALPEGRLVRVAFLLGKPGAKLVTKHLERSPVSTEAAAAVRRWAPPKDALRYLAPLLGRAADRGAALRGIRELAMARPMKQTDLTAALKGLEAPWDQALRDITLGVDAAKDRARLVRWLDGDDLLLAECAAWAVGRTGSPLLELADRVAVHAAAGTDEELRAVACWAIASLAVPGPTGNASGVHIETSPTGAMIGGRSGGDTAEDEMKYSMVIALGMTRGDRLRTPRIPPVVRAQGRPDPGEVMKQYWRFIPVWLTDYDLPRRMEFPDGIPGKGPGSIGDLPDAARAAVESALDAPSFRTRAAALCAAMEWNLDAPAVLEAACDLISAKGMTGDQGRKVAELIKARAKDLAPHIDRLLAPLDEGRVPTLEVWEALVELGSDEAYEAVARCSVAAPFPLRTWHAHALHAIPAERLSAETRERLRTSLGERFLRNEFLLAPLIAREGDAMKDVLRAALRADSVDLRMVAVATLGVSGDWAKDLLPEIRSLEPKASHASDFVREVADEIAGR